MDATRYEPETPAPKIDASIPGHMIENDPKALAALVDAVAATGKRVRIDGGNRKQRRTLLGAIKRARRQAKRATVRKGKRDTEAAGVSTLPNG